MKDARKNTRKVNIIFSLALVIAAVVFIFTRNFVHFVLSFAGVLVLVQGYFIARKKLEDAAKVSKMEEVFPDFIELMASNLRAGMTIDRALLVSSRKEFAPLDAEIIHVGKDIMTGKEIGKALQEMSLRIGSDKIKKTVLLITSGMKSGGNLSVLLEETASNMRERNFVEKKAASNVLMYVIFIFFAVAVGAPVLFGFSSVLVNILTSLLGSLPQQQTTVSLPFTLTTINVSPSFVVYFSVAFLLTIDVLASFVLGLVNKGKEKEGLKYLIPLWVMSLGVFFASRTLLLRYFSEFFG